MPDEHLVRAEGVTVGYLVDPSGTWSFGSWTVHDCQLFWPGAAADRRVVSRRKNNRVPLLTGVHHVAVPTTDPLAGSDWYVRVFDFAAVLIAERESEVVAVLLQHPCGVRLLLGRTAAPLAAWRELTDGRTRRSLGEIADRERKPSALPREVLAARWTTARTAPHTAHQRRKFPRLKRLADFNIDAVPGVAPAILGQLAGGHYMDAGEPVVLLGDSGTGKSTCSSGWGWRPANKAAGSLHHHRATGQRTRRSRRRTGPVPRRGPLRAPGLALPR